MLLVFAFCAPDTGRAFPIVAFEAQTGALFSRISLPDLLPATQFGWNLTLAAAFETRDVFAAAFDAEQDKYPLMPAFTARLQADIFGFAATAPQPDGNLYRAWQGMGLGLLAGLRSPAFRLPLAGSLASFKLEAGAGLQTNKYSGTALVGANVAILAQASLDIALSRQTALGIGIPFEYTWKSGATALIFGVGATLRLR